MKYLNGINGIILRSVIYFDSSISKYFLKNFDLLNNNRTQKKTRLDNRSYFFHEIEIKYKALKKTLHDVFVYKAGSFTYFFLT